MERGRRVPTLRHISTVVIAVRLLHHARCSSTCGSGVSPPLSFLAPSPSLST
jgi:hypothetical protein